MLTFWYDHRFVDFVNIADLLYFQWKTPHFATTMDSQFSRIIHFCHTSSLIFKILMLIFENVNISKDIWKKWGALRGEKSAHHNRISRNQEQGRECRPDKPDTSWKCNATVPVQKQAKSKSRRCHTHQTRLTSYICHIHAKQCRNRRVGEIT